MQPHAAGREELCVPTLGELMDTTFPPRNWLLEPWIREGESSMLWAAPGVGKTMFALSAALATAGGGNLIGWKAREPRKVLYVDGEMAIDDLKDRCCTLLPAMEANADLARTNLTVLARQHQRPEADFPDIASETGQDRLLNRCREEHVQLVVLDNFSTLAEVDDENAAAAMNPVLSFLMRVKQAGLACILVHHSSKSADTYRGSSKLATTFETIVGLRKTEVHAADHSVAFMLTWDKYRGKKDRQIRAQDVRLRVEEDQSVQWIAKESPEEACERLVGLVKSLDYTSQADLARAMDVSTGKLSKLKHQAIGLELITEDDWQDCIKTAKAVEAGEDPDELADDGVPF